MAIGARGVSRPDHEAAAGDGLAFERAGDAAVGGVLAFGLLLGHGGLGPVRGTRDPAGRVRVRKSIARASYGRCRLRARQLSGPAPGLRRPGARLLRGAPRRPFRLQRAALSRPARSSLGPQPTSAQPAAQTASARAASPAACACARERDEVGERGDRLEVARPRRGARGRARRGGRRPAARGRSSSRDIRRGGAVVQEVALADGLDDQREVGGVTGRARAGGDGVAVAGVGAAARRRRCSASASRPPSSRTSAASRAASARRRSRRRSANAAAAASSVRSRCSEVCASDGNHASNCDGGG